MAAKDPFHTIHTALRRDPRVTEMEMFGARGFKVSGKVFAIFWKGDLRRRRGIREEEPGTADAVEVTPYCSSVFCDPSPVEVYALTAFVYDQCVWMISHWSLDRRYTSVQFQRCASSVPQYET